MKKKGISGIVTTVLMIALVMVLGSVIWTIANNLVVEQLGEAKSCANIFNKIQINDKYTCYNVSSLELQELQFSISVGDIDVDKLLISVSEEEKSVSFILTTQGVEGINKELFRKYPDGIPGESIVLPSKDQGITYLLNTKLAEITPRSIQIAPIINNYQCGVCDYLFQIGNC